MPTLESMEKRILWLTVSNAADKSSRMRTEDLAVTLASFKASVTANRAISVECPLLNPDWFWVKEVVLCEVICDRLKDRHLNGLRQKREEGDRPIVLILSRREGRFLEQRCNPSLLECDRKCTISVPCSICQ